MTRPRGRLGALLGAYFSVLPALAHAELLPLMQREQPSVVVAVAGEPELVFGGAYLAPVRLNNPSSRLELGGGVKLTPLLFSRGDMRIHLAAAGGYRFTAAFDTTCEALPFGARARNDAGTFYGLGIELRCQPAFVLGSWSLGIDLGWQSTLTTHVHHSALARRTFDDRYPPGVEGIRGPRDGWYRFTSERFRIGLSTSHQFNPSWSSALGLGTLFIRQDQGIYWALVPIYLELTVRHGW